MACILNQQGNLIRQRQRDSVGQSGSLAKVDEIFQGKGESDGFLELDGGSKFRLLHIGVLPQGYCSIANVPRARKLNTLLGCLNSDYNNASFSKDIYQQRDSNIPDSESSDRSLQIL